MTKVRPKCDQKYDPKYYQNMTQNMTKMWPKYDQKYDPKYNPKYDLNMAWIKIWTPNMILNMRNFFGIRIWLLNMIIFRNIFILENGFWKRLRWWSLNNRWIGSICVIHKIIFSYCKSDFQNYSPFFGVFKMWILFFFCCSNPFRKFHH